MSTDEFRYSDRPDDTSDDDEDRSMLLRFLAGLLQHPTTSTPSAAQLESITAAASSGDLELLKKLFSHAAQQSQAASKGHEDIVKWVIEECGALPNLEDREGETALHKASLNGHLSILQYLLPNRADVHARDNDGWTSLHNAASKDSGERGVDVRNTIGWTALHERGFKRAYSCHPLIRNNWGETAYDVSAAVFEIYICDLLQSAELAVFSNNGLVDLYDPSRCTHHAMNGGKAKFSASGLRTSSHMGPAQSQSSRHAFELRVPGTIDKVVGAWRSDVQLPFMDDPFKLPQPGKGSTTAEGRERSCFWLSDWTIDTTHPSYDPNSGWAYAPSFTVPENDWSPSIPESPGSTASSSSTSPPPQKYVRRRRWVRLLRRRLDIPPLPFLQPDGRYYMLTTDGDLVLRDNVEEGVMVGQVQGEDYVSVARRLVGQNDWVTGDDDVGGLRRTVMKLERAVDALRSGIIGDGDAERRTQAEVLLNAYSRELERKKDEAKTRGVQIMTNCSDYWMHLRMMMTEEFVYPGAGPSSPSPRGGGTPRPGQSLVQRPSSRLATDLTPHLSHAPEFRVPTHEAPPTASQVDVF
ncbi:hypothetical protein DL96DRAFT_1707564 [Flagelloscypha sp. PMI_526]|nr:hypothetical protein DL96DRAFT_1707564 [Flagelloscypha sp. PMI_526]